MAARTAGCHCFSLCDARSAARFTSSLPEWVDPVADAASPWLDYLSAVYGSRPSHPVQLRREFSFFYLPDRSWPQHVSWPMHTCGRLGVVNNSAPCDQATCSSWLSSRSTRRSPNATHRDLQRPIQLHAFPSSFAIDQGYRGVVVFEYAYTLLQLRSAPEPYRGMAVYRNHTWVEVMRMDEAMFGLDWRYEWRHNGLGLVHATENHTTYRHASKGPVEGFKGYGCWFIPATGSGIWVNTGKTWATSHDQSSKDTWSELLAFRDAWLDAHNITDESARRQAYAMLRARTVGGVKASVEWFIPMLHELGFDSIQWIHKGTKNHHRSAELIVTKQACASVTQPLKACPPLALGLRKGWNAAEACHCSEHLGPALNCGLLGRLPAGGPAHRATVQTHANHNQSISGATVPLAIPK